MTKIKQLGEGRYVAEQERDAIEFAADLCAGVRADWKVRVEAKDASSEAWQIGVEYTPRRFVVTFSGDFARGDEEYRGKARSTNVIYIGDEPRFVKAA